MIPPELRSELIRLSAALNQTGLSEVARELETALARPVPINTALRNQACDLARTDLCAAEAVAGRIEDPWYRCQAFAHVAMHCPSESERQRHLDEAFGAAFSQQEPNRIVSVASWPLKVLCLYGQEQLALHWGEQMLAVIVGEPSPMRRSSALEQMLGAAFFGPEPLLRNTLHAFVEACLASLSSGKRHKRGISRLCRMLPAIAKWNEKHAIELLHYVTGPELRPRTEARVASAKSQSLECLLPMGNFGCPSCEERRGTSKLLQ